MKKFVLLVAVAVFAATVIGCGPAPTSGGTKPTGGAAPTGSTPTK